MAGTRRLPELPREFESALEAGAAGIGLLRTEFQFMNRDDLPDEDEQAAILTEIVKGMDGRPVTARTLEGGGTRSGTAVLFFASALVFAGVAFVPFLGYLEVAAVPALAARARRRRPDRYAGLRTLARD